MHSQATSVRSSIADSSAAACVVLVSGPLRLCDQFNLVLLLEARVQWIPVIGAVADHASGRRRREALFDGGLDKPGFMRRSACNPHGDRKTTAVRYCHDLGPFAGACWTNYTAPSRPAEGGVDEGFGQVQLPARQQIFGQRPQYLDQRAFQHPALEAAVAGLLRRKFDFR